MTFKPAFRECLWSLLISILIGLTLAWFEIWPTQAAIEDLKSQNTLIRAQIKTIKSTLPNQGKGLSSNDFYTWFKTQNFKNIKLLSLMSNGQFIHASWNGKVTALLPGLDALQNSLFSTLTLNHMQAQTAQLDVDFESLHVVSIPKPAAPVMTVPRKPQTKLLGKVHKNGVKFCVLDIKRQVKLNKEGKC